jgi:hypothetical protein
MAGAIATVARTAGAQLVETGGFILGAPDQPLGTVLALTGEKGIARRKDLFHVSGLALTALFDFADEHELTVLAQWHTHRRSAFLSKTDIEHGLNVPGFHTSVVPFYEHASPRPSEWGWWTYAGGWVATSAPTVAPHAFRTVTFEEGRVRGA